MIRHLIRWLTLRLHRPGPDGRCVRCQGRWWPCDTYDRARVI